MMRNTAARHDCTVALLGDPRVGKTCLATRLRTGKFESLHGRAAAETFHTNTLVEGRRVRLTVHDSLAGPANREARSLACREADVVLLCYRVSSPSSLFSAINHWVPEARLHAPATPLLLVGLAADQRADRAVLASLCRQGHGFVSLEQARGFASQVGAVGCVETSSRSSPSGPLEVFQLAARVSLAHCASGGLAWDQYTTTKSNGSTSSEDSIPDLPKGLPSFSRSASLSSSLNSTRSSLSLPRPSPASSRRSLCLRRAPLADPQRTVTIRCQRLTVDRVYEEVEIEVPAPIYQTLQAANDTAAAEGRKRESLGSRIKNLFTRE